MATASGNLGENKVMPLKSDQFVQDFSGKQTFTKAELLAGQTPNSFVHSMKVMVISDDGNNHVNYTIRDLHPVEILSNGSEEFSGNDTEECDDFAVNIPDGANVRIWATFMYQ